MLHKNSTRVKEKRCNSNWNWVNQWSRRFDMRKSATKRLKLSLPLNARNCQRIFVLVALLNDCYRLSMIWQHRAEPKSLLIETNVCRVVNFASLPLAIHFTLTFSSRPPSLMGSISFCPFRKFMARKFNQETFFTRPLTKDICSRLAKQKKPQKKVIWAA